MATPDPSSLDDLDATDTRAAELAVAMADIEARKFQGTDRARLVTVTVDGQGVVLDVRLVRTIGQHSEAAVGAAVVAAVDAAQRQLAVAFAELAKESGVPVPDGTRLPDGMRRRS